MTKATTNKAFMGGNGKRREPIVVDQVWAKALFDEYIAGVKKGKGNSAIIEKILGPSASPQDKLQVASHLRMMAIESNSRRDPIERTQQEIGKYLALVSQASDALEDAQEALEDVENFKSSILNAELKPGAVTTASLKQSAIQEGSAVGFGSGKQPGSGPVSPFSGKFGFRVDEEVAFEVAEIAKHNKGYVFTSPPSQKNRNAVMDSIPILKRESRLAEAEYKKALLGEELSAAQRKAIEKASPVHSSGARNFGEWLAYNAYDGVAKKLMPGIFGIDHEKDARYQGYLRLREDLVSSHRGYLSSEELRRYLTGLKNQRNEFASSATSAFDIAELDKLIAVTEEKVIASNKADMDKFAETLDKLNSTTLENTKDLTDEEAAMWKFRMLQMVLMASPFGFLNIVGPFAEILAPIFDGSLEFGEGLAQAIENIPFFGDIAGALKLTDFFELFFDQAPLISDVTGLINEVTDCAAAQELGGAAAPGMLGSPLLALGIASIFSIFRGANELEHMQKSHRVEKDAKKGLTDSFRQLRKGLSVASAETTMRDFHANQLDIILKSFPKTELVKFIAQAYQEGGEALEIFDKLKIKYKDPTSGVEEELTFNELKTRGVNFGHAGKVTNLLVKGADEEKVGKFINTFFAYRGVEGDNTADKLKEFKTFDEKAIETQGKESREIFQKQKSVAYIEDKLGFESKGSSLEERLNYYKKAEIGKFIADASMAGENLKIFDNLKIKYRNPADGKEEELTLTQLKEDRGVDISYPAKVLDLLGRGDDEVVNKFVNTMFAYQGAKGNTPAEKLAEFKTFKDIDSKAKPACADFEKAKTEVYHKEKADGPSLDQRLQYCKKQMIDHEMLMWKHTKNIVPPHTSPSDPVGHNVRDLIGRFGGGKGIAASA